MQRGELAIDGTMKRQSIQDCHIGCIRSLFFEESAPVCTEEGVCDLYQRQNNHLLLQLSQVIYKLIKHLQFYIETFLGLSNRNKQNRVLFSLDSRRR